MPKLTPSDMPSITPFVLAIVPFFPLFLNSMCFYQALSIQMVIIAGLLLGDRFGLAPKLREEFE